MICHFILNNQTDRALTNEQMCKANTHLEKTLRAVPSLENMLNCINEVSKTDSQ